MSHQKRKGIVKKYISNDENFATWLCPQCGTTNIVDIKKQESDNELKMQQYGWCAYCKALWGFED